MPKYKLIIRKNVYEEYEVDGDSIEGAIDAYVTGDKAIFIDELPTGWQGDGEDGTEVISIEMVEPPDGYQEEANETGQFSYDTNLLFRLTTEDVQRVARDHFGRELNEEELSFAAETIGLGDWESLIVAALNEISFGEDEEI